MRRYWDTDAVTYDHAPEQGAVTPSERAAWNEVLSAVLPEAPAHVLDAGAGTGFLALRAARLGHRVTALDLSPVMLSRLLEGAEQANLEVETVVGSAEAPPPGPFQMVISRHLLWTLPDPVAALAAWRDVAPGGGLALFESAWGRADPAEQLRSQARKVLRRLRRVPPSHHRPYDPELKAVLPFVAGIRPDELVELVESAGWVEVRLRRLAPVDWARRLTLPLLERPLGVTPSYVLVAKNPG